MVSVSFVPSFMRYTTMQATTVVAAIDIVLHMSPARCRKRQ